MQLNLCHASAVDGQDLRGTLRAIAATLSDGHEAALDLQITIGEMVAVGEGSGGAIFGLQGIHRLAQTLAELACVVEALGGSLPDGLQVDAHSLRRWTARPAR